MNKTYRFVLFFIAISFLFIIKGIPQTLAQSGDELIRFKDVQLWIYPEYDDPRLLVMIEGQIVGVQPPATIKFLVPSTAEMYSAGSIDAQGRYSGGPPQRRPSPISGWDEISYEVKTGTFRVEYYDPIIRAQAGKTISYDFRRLYAISGLKIIIQEPRMSDKFNISPKGEIFTDDQGFTSYLYNYTDIDDQASLHFEITYTKSDERPSLAIEGNKSVNLLLMITVVVGLCVAFGAGFFLVRRLKRGTMVKGREIAKISPIHRAKEKHSYKKFCNKCGQRRDRLSQFCPHCGNKLQ